MSASSAIAIAAGGTGGHLFPALSLAGELKRRGHKIILFTDERGLRWSDQFEDAKIISLPSATFSRRGLAGRLSALLQIGKGVWHAFWDLGKMKPSAIIGFGGYPSAPPMIAGILRRLPRCIQEQNNVMGRANRALASRMNAIAVTFPDPVGVPEKVKPLQELTGTPVRPAISEKASKPYPVFDDTSDLRLVVFGGSQGAAIFSHVVPAAIECLSSDVRKRLEIWQQCREEDLDAAQAAYDRIDIQVTLAPFFDNLPALMSSAHLIIARSGASTICELTVLGRPAILVPLPQAIDGDQAANAKFLVEAGGAWLLPQDSLTPDSLSQLLSILLVDQSALKGAAAAAKRLGKPDAVSVLADLVEKLAMRRSKKTSGADKGSE